MKPLTRWETIFIKTLIILTITLMLLLATVFVIDDTLISFIVGMVIGFVMMTAYMEWID